MTREQWLEYLGRYSSRDPDLDDGLEYMHDERPMNCNRYAEQYIGEEWKD